MELKRWSNGDDEELRCDFIISTGDQCRNTVEPRCTRCGMHGANKQLEKIERSSLRLYRLAKYQKRADELTDHAKVKSLREEIAILRILLEEKINRCSDEMEFLLASGPISELIMKIEKLVASCHRLESSLGGLLDKTRIKQIANEMMNSVSTRANELLEDESVISQLLEAVATDILSAIERKNDA